MAKNVIPVSETFCLLRDFIQSGLECAREGNRTPTVLLPPDFESGTSTSSVTRALISDCGFQISDLKSGGGKTI